MNTAEIISRLRDAKPLTKAEIRFIVEGITSGDVSDAQLGAFAMAVLWRGLPDDLGLELALSMRDSGDVLSWDVDGPIVDKHSTGGVGDCVSLALAPILAAAGAYVPMISGRGLGHTGGTLDKLEAIQGFSTQLSSEKMQDQLGKIGCVMAGQSASLAPADKRFYAVRDVTGTVPSVDLITASILSKKLAAGLEYLVLDVKCGAGAFMKTRADAGALAQRLVDVANAAECKTTALITDMNIPLCASAGNALEVREVIGLLRGGAMNTRLYQLTRALCAEVLNNCGISLEIDELITSGRALESFEKMVAMQGGSTSVRAIEASLPGARMRYEIRAEEGGEFAGFDAYEIGMAVVDLGGGRKQQEDKLDYAVGISNIAEPGQKAHGDLLAVICANDESRLQAAIKRLEMAKHKNKINSNLILEKII